MMKLKTSFLSVLLPATLGGCGYTYQGDGQFVDNGITDANTRYSLTVPGIDLCKKATYRLNVGRLPSDHWSGALRFPQPNMEREEAEKVPDLFTSKIIEMRVSDKKSGEVFHDYEGKLRHLSDGLAAAPWDASLGDGYIYLDIGIDAFGLYDPKNIFGIPFGTYSEREIVFSVIEPLHLEPYCDAVLELETGGWK
jgi:hypothetical protein